MSAASQAGPSTEPAHGQANPGDSADDPRKWRTWRDVEVVGLRLETCRFGSPDAPLRVVLLHEGLGSVAAWRDFPARLAQWLAEPVLVYSRAGYGQSDQLRGPRQPDFMHHEARIVLPALLRALDITHPILMGHSDGASIALIHAGSFGHSASAPQAQERDTTTPIGNPRPLGVVVLAPHLFVEQITLDEIGKVDASFDSSGLAPRLGRYHRDPALTFHGWADAWLSPGFRDWNIEASVAAIRCPLLAVQGRQDQYGTARQVERIGELLPRARTLLLNDCRHSPHQDQPIAVLAALTGFVAGLSCASTGG